MYILRSINDIVWPQYLDGGITGNILVHLDRIVHGNTLAVGEGWYYEAELRAFRYK